MVDFTKCPPTGRQAGFGADPRLVAFAFTKVGELPSGESTAPAQDNRIYSAEVERARTGVGPLGGPYEVSDEIQEALFEAALRDILEAIKALDH